MLTERSFIARSSLLLITWFKKNKQKNKTSSAKNAQLKASYAHSAPAVSICYTVYELNMCKVII